MAVIDDRTAGRGYALPNPANKIKDDVVRLREALAAVDGDVVDILAALLTKAAAVHGHSIDQITGLVSTLAGKAALDHAHALADLTDTDVAGVANGQLLKRVGTKWSPAWLALGDIDGWEDTVAAMIAASVASLVNSSPAALDTLGELATALGGDANFATTMATALGNRLRVDAAQGLTEAQKTQGRSNLGAQAALGFTPQAALGFTPLQQGGGAGQLTNKIYIGWSGSGLKAQVDVTNLGTVWTDYSAGASIGAAGYQRLPSGLIIQWGHYTGAATDATIAFPATFPTACRSVVATVAEPDNTGNTASWMVSVEAIGASSFLARRRKNASVSGYSTTSNSDANFTWLAMGN